MTCWDSWRRAGCIHSMADGCRVAEVGLVQDQGGGGQGDDLLVVSVCQPWTPNAPCSVSAAGN
jgi:hypothetical protein